MVTLSKFHPKGRIFAVVFDKEEHLGYCEQPDNGNKEINTIHQVKVAAGKARHARVVIKADHRNTNADT